MNILIAYNRTSWTTGSYLEKAFREEGHIVCGFNLIHTPYWTNFYNKLPFFIPKGLPISAGSVIKRFDISFDLIIEIDSHGQYHLTSMGKTGVPSALWSLDTHEPAKIRFHEHFKHDYSYIFSCHRNYMKRFGKEARWLPVACDPDIHKKYDIPKKYEVVFVGSMGKGVHPERVRLLNNLKKKFKTEIFSGVYGEEVGKIYSQAKIVFNKSVRGDLNMRVFEALSSGSMLMTDRLEEDAGMDMLFNDGEHLVAYRDEHDLLEKVGYYLQHDAERENIAAAGYREVRAKHTYRQRAAEITSIVGRRGSV